MKDITNTEPNITSDIIDKKMSEKEALHKIRITTNQLVKDCKAANIPIFLTFYLPDVGYVYSGAFPEEVDHPDETLRKEMWRFMDFLKTCIQFNEEDYKPIVQLNKKES